MGNREERNEYATAKWDAEEVRRQASSEQRRHSDRRRQAKRERQRRQPGCCLPFHAVPPDLSRVAFGAIPG